MSAKYTIAAIALLAGCTFAAAQQVAQPELKVDSTNRTLTVSATGSVLVEPDLAILHIGFGERALERLLFGLRLPFLRRFERRKRFYEPYVIGARQRRKR